MRALLLSLVIVGALATRAHATLVPQQPSYSFGSVAVGQTSTQTIVFQENGSFEQVQNVTLNGCTADWQIVNVNPAIPVFMSPGQLIMIDVSFTPLGRGQSGCVLVVQSNAGSPPPVPLDGTGIAPTFNANPSSLAFGSDRVLAAPITKTIAVTNTGDAGTTLQISSMSITGPNAPDFAVVGPPTPFTIAAGNSTDVTIQFDPTIAGARSATLTLATNDPSKPTATIPLTGTGTTALINVSPQPLDFGSVVAGTTVNQYVTVTNTGNSTLSVNGAAITGGNGWLVFTNAPAGFPSCAGAPSCNYSPQLAVGPGVSSSIQVRCAPPTGSTGTQTGTLVIMSDSDPGGTSTTMLSCTAVKPDIVVAPSEHTFGFGNVHVGSSATYNMMTITNTGGATLNYAITKSGANPGDFTITSGCATNCGLPAGSSATYVITFTPALSGARSATLTITSNDQDPPDQAIAFVLSGTGTQAVATGTPASGGTLAFGSVRVGTESATQTVTIMNTGNEALSIGAATLTLGGADYLIKAGSTGAQTVAIGASTSWTLDCKPSARGSRLGTFKVTNNSGNAPSFTINLSCTGTGPSLVASPTSIDFGTVREGNTLQKTFTLTNNGDVAATIASSTITPSNVGYTVSGVPASLAAGANATVTVTFAPLAGADGGAATLAIASDAVNTPTSVALTGVGQPFGVSITCPDCAGNPLSMDFGDVRWDQTKSEVFTITNTADADVTIENITLTDASNFAKAAPATPFVLSKGQSKTVTVTAHPNDTMLGPFTSQLEVTTDLPAPMMILDRTLRVTSVSPALSVQPGMTVDFGGVDLASHTASTMTITVQNTGDGPMDVTGAPALTGVFTSAAIPARSIAAGGMFSFDVSYLPTVEKPAGAGDSDTIVLTIDGLFSSGDPQPSAQMIQLAGHGTDRHLALDGAPIHFPDTYRNPNDADAPVAAVTVRNTGEAPLAISAVMFSADPVFTLLDSQPVTIAGGQSMPFRVRFAPTMDSGTYQGTLTLMDDDAGTPMAEIAIDGRAVSRMISVSPATTIDLGTTYVGVPVRLSDHGGALTITNHDAAKTIRVRELKVTAGGDLFRIVAPDAQTIAPGASATYDVEFTPSDVGDAAGTIEVLLDDDTIADGTVALTGRGLAGRGSYYACQAGSSEGAAPIAIAIALLVLGRRRRRRS